MKKNQQHYVAVIGGSVSGSEAAIQLAEKGFKVVVFDQMSLPYGKIEDGLPKWHAKLRDKEELAIDKKLQHRNVTFVPDMQLGKDIDFNDMVNNWGFSVVLLATGAWRDRPLPIKGIDKFIGKGLLYQNKFIKWFNHCHEAGYTGPHFNLPDGAAVIGGGLASIDVIKIIQIKNVQGKLLEHGIREDLFTMERGIDKVLDKHNLTMKDLGLKGATLFYRKTSYDMPLKPFSKPEQREKAREVSNKMLNITLRKYLFNFEPLSIPVGYIEENDFLKGIVFQKVEEKNGRFNPVKGSEFEYHTDLVVSSIGSLPKSISGLPFKGDLLDATGPGGCRIKGYDNVFALGNAVTGRGNISESRIHGRESAKNILESEFQWDEDQFQDHLRNLESNVDEQVDAIARQLTTKNCKTDEEIKTMLNKIKSLQQKVGYTGDFPAWKAKHTPVRLEEMPGKLA